MWRADHCPEFFNKPYDRDHLIHWVWQIMKGTRVVTPIQWQATRFYARLCRWDIPGIQGREQANDLPLDDCHRETLARLDAVQAARASQLHQTGAAIATDDDLSEFEAATESLPTDPDAPVEYPWMWRQATLNPTPEDSPEETTAEPDHATDVTENPHLWQNVDLNPHAQLTDNQPINPENPHLCQKSSESTFPSNDPITTPSEKSLRPPLLSPTAVKKPNTPDPLPAPDTRRIPLPPAPWPAEDLTEEETAWVSLVVNRHAAESSSLPPSKQLSPLPLPPWNPEDLTREELTWIAIAMGNDGPAWLRLLYLPTDSSPSSP